jgi:periplasmic divalent cation tolerance protein
MSDLVLILTTMPLDDRAEGIARALVEERLAACVNVQPPMTSFYRWNGRVEQDEERQLVIKTTRELAARVRDRVRQLHPYELPEWILVVALDASPEYLEWVRAETAGPDISGTR